MLLVAVVAVVALQGKGGNLSGYLGRVTNNSPINQSLPVVPNTPVTSTTASTNVNLRLTPPPTPTATIDSATKLPKIAPPDKTAPTVSIDSPTDGQTIHGNFTVIAYANDNIGVTKVEFRSGLGYVLLPAGTLTKPDPQTNAYKYTLNTSGVPDGLNLLSVWAYDAAGNVGKKTISIKLDNTGPDLSISIPDMHSLADTCAAIESKAGSSFDGNCSGLLGNGIMYEKLVPLSFNVNADASDASGISKVTFSIDNDIDNAKWGATVDPAPFTFTQQIAHRNLDEDINHNNMDSQVAYDVPLGNHFLYVQAWDKAGNMTNKTVKFSVDNIHLVYNPDSNQPPKSIVYDAVIPFIRNIQITN